MRSEGGEGADGLLPAILIIEDEENIRFSLSAGLRREGYRVLVAATAEEGLHLARTGDPDLILLDVMLPDASGLEVCRLLRRESRVPIIMVTARDHESDIIGGLEMGADDYVTKPFSLGVLLARIRANLRREDPDGVEIGVLRVGPLVMDPEARAARLHDRPLDLTPRLFALLYYLANNAGAVCTRERILNEVWGYDYLGETRTLDVHIHWLREKLADSPALILETVRGVGYRLLVEDR